MTESIKATITCPRCSGQSEAEIWASINTEQNPDEAQWLIDGFLFEHECPQCGNKMTLNHDCLYHDPQRKVLVQYVNDPAKVASVETALAERKNAGYRARIVGTREALREKAAMTRDDLDDRAVELCKFLAFNKFVEEGSLDARHTAYYGALDEDDGIIVEFIGGEKPVETTIPRSVYESAKTQVERLDGKNADPFVVDRAWVAGIIRTIS